MVWHMKLFTCQACGAQLYFENNRCLTCGRELGYLPATNLLSAIEPVTEGVWRALGDEEPERTWRKCRRYAQDGVCNWLVPADDPNEFCRSCRMSRTIPDLSVAGNQDRWRRIEIAKRRLFYGLTTLGLPVVDRHEDPTYGLVFDFLADAPGHRVFTGHNDGLITVNVAEADPVERERARTSLGEPYRTVLGHLRHESGHYYWDRLVAQGPRLDEVRALFGDDRQDYAAAMQRHYDQGAPPDWQNGYVSAYATMHPWEDWAETWAHYLHLVDAVEIARYLGLSLSTKPVGSTAPVVQMHAPQADPQSFDDLLAAWIPLTFATNCLTRSIGHRDWYPFVLSDGAIAKLRLIHTVIADVRSSSTAQVQAS